MLKRAISSLCAVGLALFIPVAGLIAGPGTASAQMGAQRDNAYRVRGLVSDTSEYAPSIDHSLVNAWGLAASPTSPWWVSDNGTNVSTLYAGDGTKIPLTVKVGGAPTGAVFNGGSDFVVNRDGFSGPSVFMFATESGTIRGWDPGVPTPAPSTRSFTVVNRHGKGAVFKGLAIISSAQGDLLYATDFANGHVDVFDGNFHQVMRGSFVDPHMPDGYAPFGIQAIHNKVFVTFAKQNGHDEADGAGLGFVDMFSMRGQLLARVASRHELNAPWGLAWAPNNFGRFSGDLLVGNFGDGSIHAYSGGSDGFSLDGTLKRPNGHNVHIDGLWAIAFGNGSGSGPTNSLYFTAGPDGESHGVFGRITAGDRD